MKEIKIAILGGSFNPPHLGHLGIADTVHKDLGLEQVYFVPAGHSPHKEPFKDTSADERQEMVGLAIEDNREFLLLDWELEQGGPSYTLKTVERLMLQRNLDPGQIGVIIGEDLLDRLHEWHQFEYLCSLITWIIVGRSTEGRRESIERLFPGVHFRYVSVDNVFLPVSSSQIRRLVQKGGSFRYLVPQKVYAYIQHNSLYTATIYPDENETLREKSSKS